MTPTSQTSPAVNAPNDRHAMAKTMLNKVPEVTLYFWIIKVLCTTVGETAADYLNDTLGLGLTRTTWITAYLTLTQADRIEGRDLTDATLAATASKALRVLVVTDKVAATPELVNAVRERASSGSAGFFLLVANPSHEGFGRASHDTHDGQEILADALPQLEHAVGSEMGWRVAASPNAYDDIVAELDAGSYDEIILETPPSHLAHRLHVDLAQRGAQLGYPLVTVVG